MKISVFMLSILFCLNVFSQTDTTTYYWSNQKVKAKGVMKQGGIEEGTWKFYDQNGKLKQIVTLLF